MTTLSGDAGGGKKATTKDGSEPTPQQQSMADTAQQYDQQQTDILQQVLNDLLMSLDAPATVQGDLLRQVTDYLKSLFRSGGKQQQTLLDQVIGELSSLLEMTAAQQQSLLDMIAQTLTEAYPTIRLPQPAGLVPILPPGRPPYLPPSGPPYRPPTTEPPGRKPQPPPPPPPPPQHPPFPTPISGGPGGGGPGPGGGGPGPGGGGPGPGPGPGGGGDVQGGGGGEQIPTNLPTQPITPSTGEPLTPVGETPTRGPDTTQPPQSVEPAMPGDVSYIYAPQISVTENVYEQPKHIKVSPFSAEADDDAGGVDVAAEVVAAGQVGGRGWCGRLEKLMQDVSKLAEWVNGKANQTWDAVTASDSNFVSHLADAIFGFLSKAAGKALMEAIGKRGREVLSAVWEGARSVWNGLSCGDAEPTFGLVIVRSLVRALKHVRIGSDLGVWATLDLDVSWDQLEAVIEYLIRYSCPVTIPDPHAAIEARRRGLISQQQYECWMRCHGANPRVWEPIYLSGAYHLSPEQAQQWQRRNGRPDGDTDEYLHRLGVTLQSDRDALMGLYDHLPSIQDHLHWLQRNVFDDDYVKDYELMDGFEDRFWRKFGNDLRAQGMKKDYAGLHYAAHWIQPGPQQLADMLYRLRPGAVPKNVEFTEADYTRLLAEQDVGPYFRRRFLATAYRVVSFRQMLQLLDTGAANLGDVESAMLDMGYRPDDARRLALMEAALYTRRHTSEIGGWTPGKLQRAYVEGVIDAAFVKQRMLTLYYSDQDAVELMSQGEQEHAATLRGKWREDAKKLHLRAVESGFREGTVTDDQARRSLEAAGADGDAAASIVESWNLEREVSYRRRAVAAIKRGWESGYAATPASYEALVLVGLQPDQAAREIAAWQLERRADEVIAKASDVLRQVEEGMMPVPTALARLTAMGHEPHEAEILLMESAAKLSKAQAALDSRKAAGASRAAKQAEALARRGQKAYHDAVAELKRQTPVAKLDSWVKKGIIGQELYEKRMRLFGYTPEVIKARITEICGGKNAACVETGGSAGLDDPQLGSPPDGGKADNAAGK
jgi:hypothetical protein